MGLLSQAAIGGRTGKNVVNRWLVFPPQVALENRGDLDAHGPVGHATFRSEFLLDYSREVTSPPSLVTRAIKIGVEMDSATKVTDPSPRTN